MPLIRDGVNSNIARLGSIARLGTAGNTAGSYAGTGARVSMPASPMSAKGNMPAAGPTRGSYPPSAILSSDYATASENDLAASRFGRSRVLAPSNPIITIKSPSSPAASAAASTPVKLPTGTPLPVTNFVVSEVPRKLNGQMVALVTAQWHAALGDPNYVYAQVWAQGYHGSLLPQLVASGKSPVTFSMDATNETAIFSVFAVSGSGLRSVTAPTGILVLSPTSGAPPAPVVSQTLVATPVGYQFQFNQEAGLLTNLVDGYNIYRNTSNTFGTATKIAYVKQSAINSGVYTFQDSNAPIGTNYFYFVTAVDIIGEESAATSAQSGTITNVAIYTASSNLTNGTKLGGDSGVTANGASSTLGLGGTPIASVDLVSYAAGGNSGRIQSRGVNGSAGFDAFDNAVNGVTGRFESGDSTTGVVHIQHAGNQRTFLNSTPQWGFYGSPSVAVHTFGQESRVSNVGAYTSVHNSGASGRVYQFASGDSAAAECNIRDGSSGSDRTTLNATPQWGFFGSPGISGQGVEAQVGNAAPNFRAVGNNDIRIGARATGTSQQEYSWASGQNSAGQLNFVQEGVAARTFLNTTPQWGFFGTPAANATVEDFANSSAFRITGTGNPQFISNDTSVSGITGQFGSGFPAVGRTFVYNSSRGVLAQFDGSGNCDLFGAAPIASSLSAGGVAFADTSGNLKLKNINNAVGTTSSPTTTATSYVVIPEMTVTITTKGNKVYVSFNGSFAFNNTTGSISIAVFRDGSQLSQDIQFSDTGTNNLISIPISFIDTGASAASHTYDVRWKIVAGTSNTLTANGTQRQIQVVELG